MRHSYKMGIECYFCEIFMPSEHSTFLWQNRLMVEVLNQFIIFFGERNSTIGATGVLIKTRHVEC